MSTRPATSPSTTAVRSKVVQQPPEKIFNTRRLPDNKLDSSHRFAVGVRVCPDTSRHMAHLAGSNSSYGALHALIDNGMRRMMANRRAASSGWAVSGRGAAGTSAFAGTGHAFSSGEDSSVPALAATPSSGAPYGMEGDAYIMDSGAASGLHRGMSGDVMPATTGHFLPEQSRFVKLDPSLSPLVHVELVYLNHAVPTFWVPDETSESLVAGEMRNVQAPDVQVSVEPFVDEAGALHFLNLQLDVAPKHFPISSAHCGQPFRLAISLLEGREVVFTDPFIVNAKEASLTSASAAKRLASGASMTRAGSGHLSEGGEGHGSHAPTTASVRVTKKRAASGPELSQTRRSQLNAILRAAPSATSPSTGSVPSPSHSNGTVVPTLGLGIPVTYSVPTAYVVMAPQTGVPVYTATVPATSADRKPVPMPLQRTTTRDASESLLRLGAPTAHQMHSMYDTDAAGFKFAAADGSVQSDVDSVGPLSHQTPSPLSHHPHYGAGGLAENAPGRPPALHGFGQKSRKRVRVEESGDEEGALSPAGGDGNGFAPLHTL